MNTYWNICLLVWYVKFTKYQISFTYNYQEAYHLISQFHSITIKSFWSITVWWGCVLILARHVEFPINKPQNAPCLVVLTHIAALLLLWFISCPNADLHSHLSWNVVSSHALLRFNTWCLGQLRSQVRCLFSDKFESHRTSF